MTFDEFPIPSGTTVEVAKTAWNEGARQWKTLHDDLLDSYKIAVLRIEKLEKALNRIKATAYDDPEEFCKPAIPYSDDEFRDAAYNNGLWNMSEIAEEALKEQ